MYDVVIIGAGMAGLTAGIYAARGNKKVKILEAYSFGGQIINSLNVENYPGFISIKGFDLAKYFYDQAKSLGCEITYEKVIRIEDKKVYTSKNVYETKSIIIASGLKPRHLGIENEEKYVGKGISYCATCDGNFYKDKRVVVVGGGNTALEDALYLSNIASHIYLAIRRDEFRGDKLLVDKVMDKSNVEVIKSANIKSIKGSESLDGVILDIKGEEKELDVDGLFLAIGHIPDSKYLDGVVDLDRDGYVISNNCETSKDYIFVAGDARTKDLRQVITAASDGAIAGSMAINYLNRSK